MIGKESDAGTVARSGSGDGSDSLTSKPWPEILARLAKGERVHESRLRITGSSTGPGLVQAQLSLVDCIFTDPFFAKNVTFGESLIFENVTFEQGLDLEGSIINANFYAFGVTCEEKCNLERLTVRGRCSFNERCAFTGMNLTLAVFEGYADLAGKFHGGLAADQTTFKNSLIFAVQCDETISLAYASFGKVLLVGENAQIENLLNLKYASIAGAAIVRMKKFGPNARLSMQYARLGSSLELTDGRLLNPPDTCIDLHGIEVTGDISILRMSLGEPPAGNGHSLSLESARVGGNAKITLAESRGKINLFSASISGRLWVDRESDSSPNAACKSINVSNSQLGEFWCKNVLVTGGADPSQTYSNFAEVNVKGVTEISGCEFRTAANFNRARFGGRFGCWARFLEPAYFETAAFRGPVRFLRIWKDKHYESCEFNGGVRFYFADFEQEANFGGAKFSRFLDLRFAKFSRALLFEWKMLKEDSVPERTQFDDSSGRVEISLRGCQYQALVLRYDAAALPKRLKHTSNHSAKPSSESQELSDFMARFPVNDSAALYPDHPRKDDLLPLLYLERYLRKEGRTLLADQVRRERFSRQRNHPTGFWDWLWNWTYYGLSNYGTSVVQTIPGVLISGALLATNGFLMTFLPRINKDPYSELVKAALAALVALFGGIFTDALKQKLGSDLR